MKVKNEIDIHATDRVARKVGEFTSLIIESVHRHSREVDIITPDGKRYTVQASDLEKAVRNATNC